MDFNIDKCNKLYFEELIFLLNSINPNIEKFKQTSHDNIKKLNIECKYYLKNCEPDNFFFENKKQIILGRYPNTLACFYKCSKYYFTISIDPYSIFQNDIFIRYIIDKPEIFITSTKKIEIETIFPIRILLSKEFPITSYSEKIMYNINEYISKKSINNKNIKIIKSLPNNSKLKTLISNSNLTSREMCLLYYLKFYFYIVKISENTILPFILVSKYDITDLDQIYKSFNKKIPIFEKLF